MENIVPFQFHFFSTKWNGNGMEMERKWNGKKNRNEVEKKNHGNGMELEWKWNGKELTKKKM